MSESTAEQPHRIGPYTVEREIGSGGMGRVFLARADDGSRVAVKVIHAQLALNPEFRRRLAREALAGARVGAPGAVAVAAADVDGDPPWIATEFIEGRSLFDRVVADGPLDPEGLRLLGASLAHTLAAVHAAGLVHRDVTPSNILLAADGPKLIDFGIARDAAASVLTHTGLALGTPQYMSPEQIQARRDVGPASDLFSLGGVLAFAATGRYPFGSGTPTALSYRIVHEEPDLAGVPDELAAVVRRCLAKEAADRPTAVDTAAWLRDRVTHVAAVEGPADVAIGALAVAVAELAASGPEPAEQPAQESAQEPVQESAQEPAQEPSQEPAAEPTAEPAVEPDARSGSVPVPGDRTMPGTRVPAGRRTRLALAAAGVAAVFAATATVLAEGAVGGNQAAGDGGRRDAGTAVTTGPPASETPTVAPAIDPAIDPASTATSPAAAAGASSASGGVLPPPGVQPTGPGSQPAGSTPAPGQPHPTTTRPAPPPSSQCTQPSAPCRTGSASMHQLKVENPYKQGSYWCLNVNDQTGGTAADTSCNLPGNGWRLWNGDRPGVFQAESTAVPDHCLTSTNPTSRVALCNPGDPSQWLVEVPYADGLQLRSLSDQKCLTTGSYNGCDAAGYLAMTWVIA